MTKKDYVIIAGDFGGAWQKEDRFIKKEARHLKTLEDRPFTTLFIDGNHENFDRLNSYPVKEWNGGHVHEIAPSILHLMRGEIYNIEGISFFTFGGARSHDIGRYIGQDDQDRVIYSRLLDPDDPDYIQKKKAYNSEMIAYRIRGESWWDAEMPTQEEMDRGLKNLAKYNNKVDYIITHDCHIEALRQMYQSIRTPDALNDYFELIRRTVEYKAWIFGHHHQNVKITDKDFCLYEQITEIPG